jgi:hypothetical protein
LCPSILGHQHLILQTLLQSHLCKEQNFALDFSALKNLHPQNHRHYANRHDSIGHGRRVSQVLLFF